tara:strand:- start:242 stop:481 length:240 start_codon:yes stop_codon:yes gene_type:complete
MTEKPDQEFDPSKVPTFDPMEEFKDRGQLHTRRDGSTTLGKKETPAERIEREERDALFYEAIKRDQMEEEKELNKRDRY